jgi:hypothetical protein
MKEGVRGARVVLVLALGILGVVWASVAVAADGRALYAGLATLQDRPGLPQGVAGLDEALTVRMAAMQDAPADPPQSSPSPFVAGLMSGIVPGSGQLAMKQKRGWIYLGIEVAAWFSFFAFRSAADQGESDARAFADDHWTFDQYEAREPCGEGLGPIDFDQERADLIEAFQSDLDTYYDEIGRNDVYACGWDGQDNRGRYVQQQDNANDLRGYSRVSGTVIFLNHVVSAVDAAKSASNRRKAAEAGEEISWNWGLRPEARGVAFNLQIHQRF